MKLNILATNLKKIEAYLDKQEAKLKGSGLKCKTCKGPKSAN